MINIYELNIHIFCIKVFINFQSSIHVDLKVANYYDMLLIST